jgi:hypothetical protein
MKRSSRRWLKKFGLLLLLTSWGAFPLIAETGSTPSSESILKAPSSEPEKPPAGEGDDEEITLTAGELRVIVADEISKAVDEAVREAVAIERSGRLAAEVDATTWKAALEEIQRMKKEDELGRFLMIGGIGIGLGLIIGLCLK